MSPFVPLVEDRLRHTVASLESLHRLAAFTSQPHEIPQPTASDYRSEQRPDLSHQGESRSVEEKIAAAPGPAPRAGAPGPGSAPEI